MIVSFSLFTTSIRTFCTTTCITESYPTSAFYWWTSLCPLNPKLAAWALLKLCPFNKFLKLSIILFLFLILSEFFTCHSSMKLSFTFETVIFCTNRAMILNEFFIILKDCRAASSWTPGSIFIITLNIFIKRKSVIFFHSIIIEKS